MLLPMFGFVAALLLVGGLGTLDAVGDPRNARLAPYLGFVGLFAGLGILTLSIIPALLLWIIFQSEDVAGLGFVLGFGFGGLGGGAFGFSRAAQRRHRIEQSNSRNENEHNTENSSDEIEP